jgi:hypothetical protein
MTLFTAPFWNADRPVWCITTTTGEKLWPYSPALLPRDKRYELQVGLKYFDTPAKKARPCKAWPRPDPERVALTLNLGSLDAAGVPTGQGLILTPWLVTKPGATTKAEIQFAAQNPIHRVPICRYLAETAAFSLETARIWDNDKDVRVRRARPGNHAYTFEKRFEVFVVWVQTVCRVSAPCTRVVYARLRRTDAAGVEL